MERTTISLPVEVKKRLLNYGNMNDSYSDVIVKLMDSYDESHKDQSIVENNTLENNPLVNDELINALK